MLNELLKNITFSNSIGVRRKIVYLRRVALAIKGSIIKKEEDILRKYCEVKVPERIVNPKTGEINLKYDPKLTDEDYYL